MSAAARDRSTTVVGGYYGYAPGILGIREFYELPQGLYGSARASALAQVDARYDTSGLIIADLSNEGEHVGGPPAAPPPTTKNQLDCLDVTGPPVRQQIIAVAFCASAHSQPRSCRRFRSDHGRGPLSSLLLPALD